MARVKGAMMTRKRRNKVMKMAKGYWGSRSKHFRVANEAVMKSLVYAYTGRKLGTISRYPIPTMLTTHRSTLIFFLLIIILPCPMNL